LAGAEGSFQGRSQHNVALGCGDGVGATGEGCLGRNQAGFVGGLAAEESEHALEVQMAPRVGRLDPASMRPLIGPAGWLALLVGWRCWGVLWGPALGFPLARRIEVDVVEQGGGEGEEQEGQRQHQDQADPHQGQHRFGRPHQGQAGGEAGHDHQDPDQDLGVDVPKGERAAECVALLAPHSAWPATGGS